MIARACVDLLFLILIKSVGVGFCDYASLSLSADVQQQPVAINESYCAVYNPTFTSIPTKSKPDAKDFHEAFFLSNSEQLDPFGCEDLPAAFRKNLSLVAERGNCTFYRKALVAQNVNASLLLVVYNETMVTTVPSLQPENGTSDDPSISIPVLFVSNTTGQEIKNHWNESSLYMSVFIPYSPPVDPGSALLFCIAVGTVLVASCLANNPFNFLRYGLLMRKGMVFPSKPEESSSKKMTVISMIIGLLVMVTSTCALLLLLYFFYSPMVYIVLALYCIASVFGLYSLLSPFAALVPLGDKLRLPAKKFDTIPILKYRPNILFPITVLISMGVVLWWAVERHSVYAWILQDILGFAFIAMLLSRLRFLKVWFVAVLMIMLFLYDIFMVFITPYFTHDGISVMEKAATGPGDGQGSQEMLPVVFLVPKLLYPSPLEALCSAYVKSRPASLLGYGDVGIPALLVTLCLKFDFQFGKRKYFRMYYATSGIAYTVGLAITYTALTLMKTAQPALLYLVPSTLGSVTLLSLARKEFTLFFTNKLPTTQPTESSVNQRQNSPPNSTHVTHVDVTETDTDNEAHMIQDERQALISTSEEDTAI